MSIIESINAQRRLDIVEQQNLVSLAKLKSTIYYKRTCASFSKALVDAGPVAIIAEHKRASPSEGSYGCPMQLREVVLGYEKAGAAAISILTEPHRFGGHLEHLREVREIIDLPLLRKDFIIDAYQVHEAKSAGADAVLLIAAGLKLAKAIELSNLAHDLGLEVLLEVHNAEELEFLKASPDAIGVNNRNLKSLEIDLNTSRELYDQLPEKIVRISESGIKDSKDAASLLSCGYQGLLVGTRFMKTESPGEAAKSFIKSTQALLNDQNVKL